MYTVTQRGFLKSQFLGDILNVYFGGKITPILDKRLQNDSQRGANIQLFIYSCSQTVKTIDFKGNHVETKITKI